MRLFVENISKKEVFRKEDFRGIPGIKYHSSINYRPIVRMHYFDPFCGRYFKSESFAVKKTRVKNLSQANDRYFANLSVFISEEIIILNVVVGAILQ